MDFIAEIILGYIDTKISVALEKLKISDYQILRYRDDYRIFSNNSRLLEEISQTISSVLIDFGMQLNDAKTTISSDLIYSAMKEDKWQKIRERLNFDNYRERLLWIYDFAKRNHNSGSLISALTDFNEILGEQRLSNLAKKEIIAVVSEIAYNNHKTYPIIAAILSKMFYALPKGEVKTIAKRVIGRLNNLTNSGHFQVWLQRSLIFTDGEYAFGEQLCKKLSDKRVQLWNVAWLRTDLAKMISRDSLIDIVKLNNINPIIPSSEIRTFKIIRRHSE